AVHVAVDGDAGQGEQLVVGQRERMRDVAVDGEGPGAGVHRRDQPVVQHWPLLGKDLSGREAVVHANSSSYDVKQRRRADTSSSDVKRNRDIRPDSLTRGVLTLLLDV